jgi:hypothetical protein
MIKFLQSVVSEIGVGIVSKQNLPLYHPRHAHIISYDQNINFMKPLSLLLPISVLALSQTPSHATGKSTVTTPAPCDCPKPGNSQNCTRVDFDKDNNGWGNGDQDAPGKSGDRNNAENGPRSAPGNGNGNSGGNGNGNGNACNTPEVQQPVASEPDTVTQQKLESIERAAVEQQAQAQAKSQAKSASQSTPNPPATTTVSAAAANVVARRVK